MKPGKDPRKRKQDEMSKDSVLTGFHSGRIYRKRRKAKKRHANHVERAGLRGTLSKAKADIDALSEVPSGKVTREIVYRESSNKKEWILHSRKRKVRAELQTRQAEVFQFILEMCRSKSLYATVAMDFFRHVLRNSFYSPNHRYRFAIDKAMKNPKLRKVIESKWSEFDRKFPGELNFSHW